MQDFIPQYPSDIQYERTIRVPVPQCRAPFYHWRKVWVRCTRKHFRRQLATLVSVNLDDVLIGMAHTNGDWTMTKGHTNFRIRAF